MEAADLEATRLPVLAGAKAEVAATNAQAMKARRIVDREAIMFKMFLWFNETVV